VARAVSAEDRALGGEGEHGAPGLAGVGRLRVGLEQRFDRVRLGDDEGRPRRQQPQLEDVAEGPLLAPQVGERVAVERDRLGEDAVIRPGRWRDPHGRRGDRAHVPRLPIAKEGGNPRRGGVADVLTAA
jgi:hypothetical protein